MGHYYAEMMCPKCGKVRCVCPLTKKNEKRQKMEDKRELFFVWFNTLKRKKK